MTRLSPRHLDEYQHKVHRTRKDLAFSRRREKKRENQCGWSMMKKGKWALEEITEENGSFFTQDSVRRPQWVLDFTFRVMGMQGQFYFLLCLNACFFHKELYVFTVYTLSLDICKHPRFHVIKVRHMSTTSQFLVSLGFRIFAFELLCFFFFFLVERGTKMSLNAKRRVD